MKILQISYSLASGGAERFVVDLCNRLSLRDDDEVVLATICDENNPSNIHYLSDISHNVRFINLHCSSGLSIKSIWRLFKVIIKEKPDIVHAHCNLVMLYVPAFLYKKATYVHTLHNLAEKCLVNIKLKLVNKYLYKKVVKPVTISNICHISFSKLYGINTDVLITNGREPIKPILDGVSDLVLNSNWPVFIHVARCSPQKNQKRLFYAFDKLYNEGVKFELICIGSNYDIYKKIYFNHPQIHILGERSNIPDYMVLADYFVLSSDYEGLPLSLLEAMSMGITPICTPAGGIVDVIEDGKNGYITKGFTEIEYYEKIKSVIMTDNKISSTLIKQDFDNKYSMEICASNYYQLYRSLYNNKI